jgi:hypothetical protein
MFRFTIRDVLWLMVVVGLVFGWWMDHRTQERNYSGLLRASEKLWYKIPLNDREAAYYGNQAQAGKEPD